MKKSNAGFSLVEFVTCNLATMVMLGATFTLLTMLLTANTSVTAMTQTHQNIRVAMNTLTRDIVMAGTGLPGGGIAVPNGTGAAGLVRLGAGGALATPDDTIPMLASGDEAGPEINGVETDAVTITTIDQASPLWNVSTIDAAGIKVNFTQDIRSGTPQLFVGDLLVFTNANGSVCGYVTKVSTTVFQASFEDNDGMDVNQPNAALGNIKSIANSPGVYPPTIATRINVITYYINNTVASHPKLMRSVNASTPQIIVDDIENLQFSFDLFNFKNNTGSANQPTTLTPDQIRSVTVSISGRSPDMLTRANKYYRFSLVSKVNVRNATFRNRYAE